MTCERGLLFLPFCKGVIMRQFLPLVLLGGWLMGLPGASAADQATPEDAKAMAIKAADYLKANGPAKALPEFSAKDGVWHDRDLYVTVQDSKGTMVAHGTNAGLVGRVVLELKDVDGKAFNHEIQAVTDSAWVDYKWQNPVSKAVETKTQYSIRVGDYVVGVGAYKQR
jgi:cytochrome c